MNHYQKTQASLFRLETAATEISKILQHNPLAQQGEWHGVDYTLVFEGNFPCIQLEKDSTAHYTLFLKEKEGVQLRLRIAKRIPQAPCPLEKRRLLASAVLSWDLL